MKTKVALIVVIIICIFLGVALIKLGKKTDEIKIVETKTVVTFSNDLSQTSAKLEEERLVNINLTTNLNNAEKKIEELTSNLKQTQGEVERVKGESAEAARVAAERAKQLEEMAKALQADIDQRAKKITDLEAERDRQAQRLGELTNQIGQLELKISDTERKLAASEGDRESLLKELKRMLAEKSELERQFNNMALLKEQVKKLKEEQAVAQRLDWMRKGMYSDKRGAAGLQWGVKKPEPAKSGSPDLNVEFRPNAPAKVVPPNNK
ncbi:MAG: hypothetical protein WCO56_13490 [Verrucomicrobiota bacterium]